MDHLPSGKPLRFDPHFARFGWRQIPKQIKKQYPSAVSVVRTDETFGSIPIFKRPNIFAVQNSGHFLAFDNLPDAELFAAGMLTESYGIEWASDLFNFVFTN